jgi:pyruvate/2-oxoglutarate dehydrogenase complex dihydrolipoamide dehydrogenase (E3) component
MTSTTQYDAMVIGAGQAGEPLSTALAQAGWKTALIERVHVGGLSLRWVRAMCHRSCRA